MRRATIFLLLVGLGLNFSSTPGQQQIGDGSDQDLALGETFTSEGVMISPIGRKGGCWVFRTGTSSFAVYSLPSDFQQEIGRSQVETLRVVVTGRAQAGERRAPCSSPRLVIDEIRLADGPQLRGATYTRLKDAQACLLENDYDCAKAVLNEIQADYDLNVYEKLQVLSFWGYLHSLQNEYRLAIKAYEEILTLGDIAQGVVPGTWRALASLYFHEARYEEALDAIDKVCSFQRCDLALRLRERIVLTMEGRPQIQSQNELDATVVEMVQLAQGQHDCSISIVQAHFSDFAGDSVVLVALAGDDCPDAMSDLRSRGESWRIRFEQWPAHPSPPRPRQGFQPPQNFDLIYEVIE
jgi:hypothetical protein